MGSKTDVEKSMGLIAGLAIAEMLSTGQLQVAVNGDARAVSLYADDASLGPLTRKLCDQPISAFQGIFDTTIGLHDLLYLMVLDTPMPRILSDLLYRMHPTPAMEQALHRIGHVIGWGSESRALKHIRASGVDDDTLPVSLYYVMRYDETPLEGVIQAAQITENDRIFHIVGLATGLRHGVNIFPNAWLRQLPQRNLLTEIATTHAASWIDMMSKLSGK